MIEGLLCAASVLSTLAVVAILVAILYFCAPLVSQAGLAPLFAWTWNPEAGSFGILPMVAGSLTIAILALALAFPAALGIVGFASGMGPPLLARTTMALVHFMTSIPTIIYAFIASLYLPPLIRGLWGEGSGFCLLAATSMLAVLVLPTLVLLIHAHWQGLVGPLCLTGETLGLTRAQCLLHRVLPASRRGLIVALLVGFGRTLGDTMIALLLSGNAPHVPESPLAAVRTLTAHIAMVLAVDTRSPAWYSVFAAGAILLLTTTVVSLSVRTLTPADPGDHEVATA